MAEVGGRRAEVGGRRAEIGGGGWEGGWWEGGGRRAEGGGWRVKGGGWRVERWSTSLTSFILCVVGDELAGETCRQGGKRADRPRKTMRS